MSDTKPPVPRFTAVTLGASNMKRSMAFYESLGFARKLSATGETVAFFDTGATVLALYPWDQLAADATVADAGPPPGFRGMTLAWNCRSGEEVDEVLAFAIGHGAKTQKPAARTEYGRYSGYFSDPDGHLWEVVVAPGIEVGDDRRVHLPD